jgi:phenylalanyl-tRNA synthetase alpha chain
MMGAGMVHPHVIEHAGLNPREYQGFAFGGGLDRLVMLKTEMDDIRMLYNGDLRLVNQF